MSVPNHQPLNQDLEISSRDILFECPACRKSLVIDEAAQGMIVDCPQCKTSVIVPPKTAAPAAPPKPAPSTNSIATAPKPQPAGTPPPPATVPPTKPAGEPGKAPVEPNTAVLLDRLVTLGNQLKELQTQRTEIATNVAARLNEINRQMVMLARQETAHHQVLSEVNQIVQQLKGNAPKTSPSSTGKTQVNLRA